MPMYDFECNACKHAFETIARLDETPECPACKSTDTTRLMGAPTMTGQAAISYSAGTNVPGRPKSGPGRS